MRPSGVRSNRAPHASSSLMRSGASCAWICAMRRSLSQDSDIVNDAHRAEADVDVGQRDREQRAPGKEHVVAVERAHAAPRLEARLPAPGTGEAVDLPADQVSRGVTAERVTGQEN